MAHPVPPELLAPEEREARAVELERRVGGAWADAISWSLFVTIVVVLGTLLAALTVYWVYGRIRPVQNEIAALRAAR